VKTGPRALTPEEKARRKRWRIQILRAAKQNEVRATERDAKRFGLHLHDLIDVIRYLYRKKYALYVAQKSAVNQTAAYRATIVKRRSQNKMGWYTSHP
jgi:hypothetical protein